MSLISRAAPLLAATAAAFVMSASAFAQDNPPPPGGDMAQHKADHAAWKKAREEHRAKFLHDILNIRSDQEPAFQAFLADTQRQPHEHMGPAGQGMKGDHKDAEAAPMTTPERLDRMAAFMAKHTAERQAAFQRRADAVKRFYAVLGPEQKRAFDALHAMRGGHGGGRGGRHDGGSDGGGHPGWGGDHQHGEES